MSTTEKVAYLKGLAEGIALDKDSKEGKLFSAIIDILGELAQDVEDLDDGAAEMREELEELQDDVTELEDSIDDLQEILLSDDEDEGDEPCCFHRHNGQLHLFQDENTDDDDEDGDGGEEEDVFYEVTCPACGNTITVDEDVLLDEEIDCPGCGEHLEFDFGELGEDGTEDDEDDGQ